MGQYLKGNNMAQKKFLMADIIRMRKFLMLLSSVFVLAEIMCMRKILMLIIMLELKFS